MRLHLAQRNCAFVLEKFTASPWMLVQSSAMPARAPRPLLFPSIPLCRRRLGSSSGRCCRAAAAAAPLVPSLLRPHSLRGVMVTWATRFSTRAMTSSCAVSMNMPVLVRVWLSSKAPVLSFTTSLFSIWGSAWRGFKSEPYKEGPLE